MEGDVKKSSQSISGVRCAVNTCHFYGAGDCCMASSIEIRSKIKGGTQDTDCATFVPKVAG